MSLDPNAKYHYAVVIGINIYRSDRLPSLSGPSNDAKDFKHWLKTEAGLNPDNIREVEASASSADDPLQPTLLSIHKALSNVNAELFGIQRDYFPFSDGKPGVVPNSRLYIFVAGHGMAQKSVTAALFAPEAVDEMWGYLLSLNSCVEWYTEYGPFAEVVMFADVCRGRYPNVGSMGLPFNQVECSDYSDEPRTIIYYATSNNDVALEDTAEEVPDPNDRRGYFSRALTECLSTAVDPLQGYVTSVRLARDVRLRVAELSSAKGRPPQVCRTKGDVEPPLLFGPKRSPYPVTIRLVSEARGEELQLRDGVYQVIASFFHKTVGDIWQTSPLWPGLYDLVWANTPTLEGDEIRFSVTDKPESVDV